MKPQTITVTLGVNDAAFIAAILGRMTPSSAQEELDKARADEPIKGRYDEMVEAGAVTRAFFAYDAICDALSELYDEEVII